MMDSGSHKRYNIHGFDSRQHLEHYWSDKPGMDFTEDCLIFPIENLTKTFKEGHIKGDVLIDVSTGSLIHHLIAVCEFFKQIIVLKVNDRCILEMKRWLDKRTGAFYWGHAAKIHAEALGNSTKLQDTEGKVKEAAQHVVKCNFDRENITHPIDLPPADCIISVELLEGICKEQDDYIRYLRKFSGLLKPGGHLILIGCLDMTYYTVGKYRYHALTYDEDFARKALAGEGFVIDNLVIEKKKALSDITDYKNVIYIVAHKEK